MNEQHLIQKIIYLYKKSDFKLALIEANLLQINHEQINRSYLFNNILGLINLSLKDWDTSIFYFNKCITLDNKKLDAYYNLGIVYNDLGEISKSLEYFVKVNKKFKNHLPSIFAIIRLLTCINPLNKMGNHLIELNNKIQKIDYKINFSKPITNKTVNSLLNEGRLIIKDYSKFSNFNENQIYRRNKIDLNCERHEKIFNKFKTIPSFCFGCFKIVFYLENVSDLIKLTLFFDQYKNLHKYFRKCMIPKKNNEFKGFIYLADVNEAKKLFHEISPIIETILDKKVKSEIKRGCSEFSEEYPEYKKIENMMSFPNTWKKNELIYDELNYKDGIEKKRIQKGSLLGFTLSDFLIYNNWISV